MVSVRSKFGHAAVLELTFGSFTDMKRASIAMFEPTIIEAIREPILVHKYKKTPEFCPRSQVELGNALSREVALRNLAMHSSSQFQIKARYARAEPAVQLPEQGHSQVQLGNEERLTTLKNLR